MTTWDAHISVSSIYLTYDFDWLAAKREIERALELNPNSASAHQSLAEYLVVTGRTDEAVLEGQRARELDPLSSYVNRDLGRYLYYARRYGDAEKQLLQTLDLDPGFGRAVWEWIGWCKEKQGRQSEAVDDFLKMPEADRCRHAEGAEAGVRTRMERLLAGRNQAQLAGGQLFCRARLGEDSR